MKRLLLCSFVLSSLLLVGAARADVAPPNLEPCVGKAIGALCLTDTAVPGTCQDTTCQRLDYAHWDRDASSSPPSASYPCVLCTAIIKDIPPAEGCSCTLGKGSLAKRAAPWLMAGAFALLFRFSRRRSR